MSLIVNVQEWIQEAPEHPKTLDMCDKAVCIESCSLAFVPDRFKTEKM